MQICVFYRIYPVPIPIFCGYHKANSQKAFRTYIDSLVRYSGQYVNIIKESAVHGAMELRFSFQKLNENEIQ